jgi:hypothetical protein
MRRPILGLTFVVTLAFFAQLLSACGSSPSRSSSGVQKACRQISAVLSDGPDPGTDPVGYALAQVLPLRQIHAPDTALQDAVDALASAYQTFYRDDGTPDAKRGLGSASAKVNAICPDAAS